MATLTFISKLSLNELVDKDQKQISHKLVASTSEVLGREAKDLILIFQNWGNHENEAMPDVLLRVETSVKNRHLLGQLGKNLLKDLNEIFSTNSNSKLRIAVKPFVIDSEWFENRLDET